MISLRAAAKFDKQATLILINQEQVQSQKFAFENKFILEGLKELVSSGQITGENGEIFPFLSKGTLVVFLGIGKKSGFSLSALRISVRRALLSSYLNMISDIEIIPHEDRGEIVRAVTEAVLIGTYAWKKYKTKSKDDKIVDQKNVFLVSKERNVFEETVVVCDGVNLARDLINDNADTVTSDYLESTIRQVIKGHKNVSIEILNKKEMEAKGLGLHLAVNQGSPREPKLIIVKYNGASKDGDYTAFIGKGMTYDTGGLNLKPTGSMETMRTDMSGSAAVIGTLKNVLALGLKKNILFTVAIAENVIGSKAFKPGDVFRSYAGKTVEIGNTDAEGRLVLADAISYVIKNYKPARIVDIATLTGACVVALGHDYSGLVTTDDDFSRQLIHASNETDDRLWRLPSYPELKDAVKSKIADIRNMGYPKGAAGTMTAAEFLRQFAEGTTWAHLDIAGTAFVDGDGRMYYGHGATGVGVRLLTHYFKNN